MTKPQTSDTLRPRLPRIATLLGASALVAIAALFSWKLSPGKDAVWFGLSYIILAALGTGIASSLVLGAFVIRRLPVWCVGLAGLLGAGGIFLMARNLDFRQVVATHEGSQGQRAVLLLDDSGEFGVDLVFRIEHANGSLAGEETIPGPLFLKPRDVKDWNLGLREYGGQLQVVTSTGKLLARYSPATGKISTRTFDPADRN